MKFDINEFVGKIIAVNCRTEDEAKVYLTHLHNNGIEWHDGRCLIEDTQWDWEKEETCYSIHKDDDGVFIVFHDIGHKVVPFSELEFEDGDKEEKRVSDHLERKYFVTCFIIMAR